MENTISNTSIKDVLIISRPVFKDERGFFRETFRKEGLEKVLSRQLNFVQGNHSNSKKDTLRGLHIAPWNKLITVTNGQVQQVVVDCRPESESFGKHETFLLGAPEYKSIFVPAGCANGFLVLSDEADYVYFVTDYWAAGAEKTLKYNDSNLGIAWQSASPFVSERDAQASSFEELFPGKETK